MKEEKTIREWLETLPAPYAQQAIENATLYDSFYLDNYKCTSIGHSLCMAFNWENTTQGVNYWSDIQRGVYPIINLSEQPSKEFHVCWLIGKDEHGFDLSTGKTFLADSPEHALSQFRSEFGNDVELIYIQKK